MKENIIIHQNIEEKLDYFIKNKKIPNILFHGPSGSGKRTLILKFIDNIYITKELKQKYVLFINCAQGKGIKFIREDLKFFAKTNIHSQNGILFKTIILSNADKLTIDAQSALRRCIELFSHSTRFFIIVEDKYKLLNPILSRFSEIYIPLPIINNKPTNLHIYNINNNRFINIKNERYKIKSIIKQSLENINSPEQLYILAEYLYNKGICGNDLINYITTTFINSQYKYKLLTAIQKSKIEIHNEIMTILFILNLIFYRSEDDLENILNI
jgi:DNA polymerase III delta prime subunit